MAENAKYHLYQINKAIKIHRSMLQKADFVSIKKNTKSIRTVFTRESKQYKQHDKLWHSISIHGKQQKRCLREMIVEIWHEKR